MADIYGQWDNKPKKEEKESTAVRATRNLNKAIEELRCEIKDLADEIKDLADEIKGLRACMMRYR